MFYLGVSNDVPIVLDDLSSLSSSSSSLLVAFSYKIFWNRWTGTRSGQYLSSVTKQSICQRLMNGWAGRLFSCELIM